MTKKSEPSEHNETPKTNVIKFPTPETQPKTQLSKDILDTLDIPDNVIKFPTENTKPYRELTETLDVFGGMLGVDYDIVNHGEFLSLKLMCGELYATYKIPLKALENVQSMVGLVSGFFEGVFSMWCSTIATEIENNKNNKFD